MAISSKTREDRCPSTEAASREARRHIGSAARERLLPRAGSIFTSSFTAGTEASLEPFLDEGTRRLRALWRLLIQYWAYKVAVALLVNLLAVAWLLVRSGRALG